MFDQVSGANVCHFESEAILPGVEQSFRGLDSLRSVR
jgi:hypothetical protein